MPVGLPEFVENPENRCPVILLLDTSGSMSGQPRFSFFICLAFHFHETGF